MALLFFNWNPQTIWIAFAFYDPGCGPANQNFRKQGWWRVEPYHVFNGWNVDLRTVNRFAYFYAETANDGNNWSGKGNAWLSVNPSSAFSQCAFDNSGDHQWVDFFQLDFAVAPPGWDLLVGIGPIPGEITTEGHPPGGRLP